MNFEQQLNVEEAILETSRKAPLLHEKVAHHYERYPYPSYPLYMRGTWKQLSQIDIKTWGAERKINDVWLAGCGTIAPFMFGRRNFDARILGTDLSAKSLQFCKARLLLYGIRNVSLKVEDLSVSDYHEQFDAVDSYGVLHHLVDPLKGLQKLAQSLRKGGVLRLMLYSKEAREKIESLRSEIATAKIESVSEARFYLKEKKVSLGGDLSNTAGLADALLHPLVHTYSEDEVDQLLGKVSSLKIRSIDSRSNHLIFALKK